MNTTEDYVVLREGYVLRRLCQAGEVVPLHQRQAAHASNVMLKTRWDKLDEAAQRRLAHPHDVLDLEAKPKAVKKKSSAD